MVCDKRWGSICTRRPQCCCRKKCAALAVEKSDGTSQCSMRGSGVAQQSHLSNAYRYTILSYTVTRGEPWQAALIVLRKLKLGVAPAPSTHQIV